MKPIVFLFILILAFPASAQTTKSGMAKPVIIGVCLPFFGESDPACVRYWSNFKRWEAQLAVERPALRAAAKKLGTLPTGCRERDYKLESHFQYQQRLQAYSCYGGEAPAIIPSGPPPFVTPM
ncbi:hypothetical protein COB52_02770 [Candidatus Kaiserbacteria bacterium]|nr:MAG: hypothetical protein COB52_02770 [Candidatus Kaiserbacteria bacterium]